MQPESRDWYLSAMGVVQYRLRGSSGAGASGGNHESGIPKEETRLSRGQQPVVTGGHKSDDGAAAILKSLVAEKFEALSGSVKTAVPAEETPVEKDRGKPEASVAFRLAYWRPSEDLLVIDSWPRGLGQESQRMQLLANVLKSIRRKPHLLPPPEFIDWPVGGDASLPAASAYLTMFIKGRYQQAPFKWLLAMGEDSATCLGCASGTLETSPAPKLIEGVEVICTYSLTEMIERPACKRDVWQAIRFLSA